MNLDKTEFMYLQQDGANSSFNGKPLKLVDQFIYHGSNISFTESDVNTYIGKAWTVIDRLLTIWKSDFIDKIKWKIFQVLAVSVLLYGCTNWTLTNPWRKS